MNTTASTRITVFGKIPTYGDFVQMNCTGPVWARFDRWLQIGVDGLRRSLGNRFKQHLSSSAAFRFLFSVREAGGIVSGVARPSTDRIGRFSFLIVAALKPLSSSPAELASLPVRLRAMYDEADKLSASAAAGTLGQESLLAAAVKLPTGSDAAPPGKPTNPVDTDDFVLRELRNSLTMVTGEQVSRFKLGFRLPVSETDPESSVAGWLETASQIVDVADRWNPCAFWYPGGASDTDGSVTLCLSEPSPNVLRSVVDSSSEVDEVLNLVGARS